MHADPIIKARELSVAFGQKFVLKKLELELFAGELVAVIGPNGAGKSSLLRVLSGELDSIDGEVIFQGRGLQQWSIEDRAKHLAVLPQHSLLNFPYTVREVVELARIPHASGRLRDSEIIMAALAAMDLLPLVKQIYTQLSGGEKQRVQLARVLAQVWPAKEKNSGLLLLDEPCSALDPGHAELLIARLKDFCERGLAIVMVIHDINFASQHAANIVVMDAGCIVAKGTNKDVIKADLLNNLFKAHGQVFEHPTLGHPVYL